MAMDVMTDPESYTHTHESMVLLVVFDFRFNQRIFISLPFWAAALFFSGFFADAAQNFLEGRHLLERTLAASHVHGLVGHNGFALGTR